MINKNEQDKPFYGFDKREENEALILIYEVWENYMPDKVIGGQKVPYVAGILSPEQQKILVTFWKELGGEIKDPVLSIQLDKKGGATILYRYSDNREGPPPNAKYKIIKPIFEKGIEKMVLADSSRSSFIFHTSINSASFENDIKYFSSIIEQAVSSDRIDEKDVQKDIFSNTFIFDRRINK